MLRLRLARPDDHPDFERWFPLLGSGDPTPSAERWEAELVASCTVAELEGQPVGYCFAEIFGADGYVRHLVVDPAARRSGAGRALLQGAASTMRRAGCSQWRLNVRDDNQAALRLYGSLGLEVHHACCSLRFPPALVDTLPEVPDAAAPTVPTAAQCAELERHFELPAGQLDAVRNTPSGRVLAVVGAPAGPRGVAAFDVVGQGSFPFRSDSLACAWSLLVGVRAHARGPEMGVVSEDVDAFERRLIDAGARVAFRFVHMRGPL